ncbi:MAG: SPFH domain-containing protein, partial [Methanocorpusculum sp.]|nr:SPFH domain-containing protein [Methanocorpusculum sp.]
MEPLTLLAIILVVIILFLFAKGVVIVQPYQKGLAVRLGTYTGQVNPGFKWVVPFITTVVKLDLRTQVIDVPSQEVITKDNSPTDVDAIIYVRVMDPER